MIISIARQCGCGALNVGKMLAEYYDIPFYTRKTLMDMASQRGVLEEMETFFDERPVDELLFAMSSFGETRRDQTEKTLRTLANMIGNEDCIIVGRCGNYIFRERKDLVSVFLKGEFGKRIQDIQNELSLSYSDAKDFVEHADDCREAYHKYYTELTWGNANDYDLCIDTMRLGAEETVRIIEQYVNHTIGKKD